MIFQDSAIAHQYLDGFKHGLEIGGSAHNPFHLSTRNVDTTADLTTVFKHEEIVRCGEAMPVDIVADGAHLPLGDKSVDFVISSHVIEHFHDPLTALHEWHRVARHYVLLIVPQRDALESDRDLPLTTETELVRRLQSGEPCDHHPGQHCSRWTSATFLELCEHRGYKVELLRDPDDKVGNGFLVLLRVCANPCDAGGHA